MAKSMDEALSETFFKNREKNFRHFTYDEEMLQYEEMKDGNPDAIRLGRQMFNESHPDQILSSDPLTAWKYNMVASTTLCCRFAMDGGMDSEMSYNISDLSIQKLDHCETIEDVWRVHDEMFRDYTERMAKIARKDNYSRAVLRAMDYVDLHLHDHITLKETANYTGVTPSYLSAVFSKEVGVTLSEYVRRRRVEAAKVLLQYYDYTVAEISEYLDFSSPSHFVRVFRKETGVTPNVYRNREFRHHWK